MRPAPSSLPRSLASGLALGLLCLPAPGWAASIDGAGLGWWWALPFAGLLLSIALWPLLGPRIWHAHFGKVTAGWMALVLLPLVFTLGAGSTAGVLVHTLLTEYLPFVLLLTALFTTAGGIYLRGNLPSSPWTNVALMAVGSALASVMGTTGASMLMIRPLLRANDNRRHRAHVVVFFIFIVSNAGGALTPLGDPPLFLGFLKGVDFTWTLQHLWPQTLWLVGTLLTVFFFLDRWFFAQEGTLPVDPTPDSQVQRLGVEGAFNFALLAVVVAAVLLSALWKPGVQWNVLGTTLALQEVTRDLILLAVVALSLAITPRAVRERNQFSWGPMAEVAKLFAGIFVTMLPVLAMLRAGDQGPFGSLLGVVTGPDGQPVPWAYFWLSGALSSFLDNAPTYLVFFNLAGGDAQQLMTQQALVLAAISAGSVFMGANTYIGNAPNFMVRAIAEERGVEMPSFFGYMAWSGAVLLPLFVVMTLLWWR